MTKLHLLHARRYLCMACFDALLPVTAGGACICGLPEDGPSPDRNRGGRRCLKRTVSTPFGRWSLPVAGGCGASLRSFSRAADACGCLQRMRSFVRSRASLFSSFWARPLGTTAFCVVNPLACGIIHMQYLTTWRTAVTCMPASLHFIPHESPLSTVCASARSAASMRGVYVESGIYQQFLHHFRYRSD